MLEQAQPEQPQGDSGSLPLEQRIADKFGGTAPPEQEQEAPEIEASDEVETEGEQQEETFELDFDGAKYVLPKKLEKGFSQERDYTQKSQALADQRRLVEHQQQQFQIRELQSKFDNEVANEVRQIQMIDAVLGQKVDWSSMSTDDAFRHKIQLDDLERQKGQLRQQIQGKWDQFKQQTESQRQELLNKSRDIVKQRIPNWNDDIAKQIRSHAANEGYSEAELGSIEDPRRVITLWKAMQYDQLQAKATPAVAQAKVAKTTSSKPMAPETKQYLNYRKAVSKTAPNSPERKKVVESRIANIFSR